jgi:hypothetical protein
MIRVQLKKFHWVDTLFVLLDDDGADREGQIAEGHLPGSELADD